MERDFRAMPSPLNLEEPLAALAPNGFARNQPCPDKPVGVVRERAHGISKISRHVVWEAFWLVLRFHAPLREIFNHLHYLFNDYNAFVDNHPVTQKRQRTEKTQ